MVLASRLSCRGTYRDRHETWGGDAVDVKALTDERRLCGRRSRVVLARPCRRQVLAKLKSFAKMTVANAGSPGRVRISRKPSRGEGRCDHRLYLWFSRSRKFFLREGPGCSGHPAFPAPSVFQGR